MPGAHGNVSFFFIYSEALASKPGDCVRIIRRLNPLYPQLVLMVALMNISYHVVYFTQYVCYVFRSLVFMDTRSILGVRG